MTDKTGLGDRMKVYERAEAGRRCLPLLPICARIDGKRFSRFTVGLERPYDERLSRLMIEVTKELVEHSHARIGYTQSDEISLLLHADSFGSQVFLDGRVQKLTSILASMATAHFNALLPRRIPEKAGKLALFDCRVWTLPSREEAANVFLWREQDATKNSISMAARAHYSHRELDHKNAAEMQEMLFQKGVNWNDYPAFFKRGTVVRRQVVRRAFTAEELDSLPPMHAARKDPELMIERSELRELELPPLGKLRNRVAVLFEGAEPELVEQAQG
ncbi:MAG: tRNA(His) guanylyltransferase Thg1 family protein [Enhygromyxa sp.]